MTLLMSRLRRVRTPGVALIALAALTGAATAQVTAEQQSAIRSNCRSDFMSKCSGVKPGGKDALTCLQKNVASLSPSCKTAISATIPAPTPAEAKPARAVPAPAPAAATTAPAAAPAAAPPAPAAAAVTAAPQPPAASSAPAAAKTQRAPKPAAAPKQPAAVPPKQAVAAPAATAPVAAPPAPAAPAPTAQQVSAIKFTCGREFSRFCKGVAPGGAEAVACLQGNAAKLSADCKTSLADLGEAMPAAAGPVVPPQPAGTPKAPIVMTAVIGRSCLRDLVKHCRDVGVGDGQKIACLTAHADSLTVMCRAAMKITTPLQR